MSEIVVCGGGLTGLSAAWELERLNVAYTLVELKARLGGSIRSRRENGFVLDAGPLTYEKPGDWAFLHELGLEDQLITDDNGRVFFRDGAETLVQALESRITRPVMRRMAVSSLGALDAAHYGVCLENGLLLDAAGLIITTPAAYTEHMLRSLQPEAAYRLLDYRYDSVARVTLGYRKDDIDLPESAPEDYPITYLEWTDHPARVSPGHVLVQAGVRLSVVDEVPGDLPLQLAAALRWPLNPSVQRVDYWPHAFPLTRQTPEHAANMAAIDALLPGRVALAGSDYRALSLDQQGAQGRAAARRVAQALRQS